MDSLLPLVNNLTMDENRLEALTNHVFRHIIALSISLPIASRSSHSNITIDHKNIEMLDMMDAFPFYLDDYDVLNIPFLPCPCKIYKRYEPCAQCNGERYSVRNFQYSPVYLSYTRFYGINKTNFLETADELLSCFSTNRNNYFENWSRAQKDIFHVLLDYISCNWNDTGEYDSKYKCTFPMDEMRFTYRIGC